jgi:hypothetical protein
VSPAGLGEVSKRPIPKVRGHGALMSERRNSWVVNA